MVDPEAPTLLDSSASDDALIAQEDGAVSEPISDAVSETGTASATITGARLVVKRNGAETEEVFPISTPATIGRFDPAVGPIDVDLGPLPEGQYVSRKHARLTETDGVWSISDLGSSNGTFVLKDGDFERAETAELGDGDEFALGNARFVLRLS